MSIESVMPSNHPILCRPFLLLISVFPSIRVFSNESALRLGDQSTGTSTSASVLWVNTQDWFPLGLTGLSFLLSKGLLSLLQHNLKVSICWCPAFFMVQLLHLYMTTGKTITLTTRTFVGKMMSLLLNMLSMFVIPSFQRSLLTSWPQSLSAVILESKKIKSVTASTFSPSNKWLLIIIVFVLNVFRHWLHTRS